MLQKNGYDSATGIVFIQPPEFPLVPDRPTKDDAITARDLLLSVVTDFPFASAEHRAAWLASLLTPPARFAFNGPAPLFLTDGNTPGCGKGLLIDTTAGIVSGRDMARMTAPRDDDEARKRITAIALAAETLVLIDNISGALGCPSLDAALTATHWSDRILGASKTTGAIPLNATFFGTGNNVIIRCDTARRTLYCRLESPLEKPEERTGFTHPNLRLYVRENRGRLAVAAMTILRAYCVAGRPDMRLPAWGSYEAWSELIRNAVVWVGLPDPAATRAKLAETSDTDAGLLRAVISGWEEIDPDGKGVMVSGALKRLADNPDQFTTLREALTELGGDAKLPTRRIGNWMQRMAKRIVGGRCIEKRIEHNTALWLVRLVDSQGGTEGTGGTDLTPNARKDNTCNTYRPQSETVPQVPPVPPSIDPTECEHEAFERTTFDGYLRTECRHCGEVLADDRRPEPQPA